MLVYATELFLAPAPPQAIHLAVRNWFVAECGRYFGHEKTKLPWDTSVKAGRVWAESTVPGQHPFAAFHTLSRSEPENHGRRWIIEIGAEQAAPDAGWRVTVLVRVDDISPLTQESQVYASRPGVLDHLIAATPLQNETAGREPIVLGAADTARWRAIASDDQREHAVCLITPEALAAPIALDCAALQHLLLGVAQVCVIDDPAAHASWIRSLPEHIAPHSGAVFLLPARTKGITRRLPHEYLAAMGEGRLSRVACVFHEVLHATNRNLDHRHLSPALVRIRMHEQRLAALGDGRGSAHELRTLAKMYQSEIARLRRWRDDANTEPQDGRCDTATPSASLLPGTRD